jgi:hypothetical protein
VAPCGSCNNRRFGGTGRLYLQGRRVEATRTSQTPVPARSTRRHIPEDGAQTLQTVAARQVSPSLCSHSHSLSTRPVTSFPDTFQKCYPKWKLKIFLQQDVLNDRVLEGLCYMYEYFLVLSFSFRYCLNSRLIHIPIFFHFYTSFNEFFQGKLSLNGIQWILRITSSL